MDFWLFGLPNNLPLLLEDAKVGTLFKLILTFLYELLFWLVVVEFKVDFGEYFVLLLLLLFGLTI